MRIIVALFALLVAVPAVAQELMPYTLTTADADSMNARRPPSWPRVHAGDEFQIDAAGVVHIPTRLRWIFLDDLEPKAAQR